MARQTDIIIQQPGLLGLHKKPLSIGRRLAEKKIEKSKQGSQEKIIYPNVKQNQRNASLVLKYSILALAIGSLLYENQVAANPTGGKVVAGSAQIIQKAPGKLDIIQNSHKAIIDWRGFSIAKGEHTRFRQPSSSAIALNRVRGGQASFINGALTANGNVWLINPNGVLFGKSAQVNVRGLMATTSDINNDDFMAGRYLFDQPTDNSNAAIVNQGQIEVTDDGSIVLAGPRVSNEGSIKAKLGHVVLASGDTFTMDFHGDGLLQFDIGEPIKQSLADDQTTALVSNQGKITVDGGIVEMTARTRNEMVERVINMEGVIQAKAVGVDGGTIILSGGEQGIVAVSGLLDVSGNEQGQVGGVAKVLGQKVGLLDGAEIDASGDAGGGEVLVGGNLQGAGPEQNAMETIVAEDVLVKADASYQGDGGKVVVWADETAEIKGELTARGGNISGDGGFIETSAKQSLKVSSSPDASASNGKAGTWLLDPTDITIISDDQGDGINTSIVYAQTISNSLNTGTSVTLDTSTATNTSSDEFPAGNITQQVGATISKTTGGDATLTLQAENNIVLNDSIIATANQLNVVLNSNIDAENGGAIVINPGSEISSNGGDIVMGGGDNPLDNPAIATDNNFRNGIQIGEVGQAGVVIDAGGGNITMSGKGLLNQESNSPSGIVLFSKSIVRTSGDGNIKMNGFGGDGDDSFDPNDISDQISKSNAIAMTNFSEIITENGNIELIGVADGEGRENNGVLLQDSKVTSTGTGSISIEGIGGNGNFANRGIYIEGEDSQILTDSGNITLIGTGGQNSINDSDTNDGVSILNGGAVESQTGNIFITGTGGFGIKGNQGINLGSFDDDANVVSAVRSNGGDIELIGTGLGEADNPPIEPITFEPGNRNHGIAVFNNGIVETSGNGNITLRGEAENSDAAGVFLSSFNDATQTFPGPKISTTNGTGTILLNANRLIMTEAELNGSGQLKIESLTPDQAIIVHENAPAIGEFDPVGFDINNTGINAGFTSIEIGSSENAGKVSIDSQGVLFNDATTIQSADIEVVGAIQTNNKDLILAAGNAIQLDNNLTTNGGNLTINGDSNLGVPVTLSTSGGALNFNGKINGANELTLLAGTGNIQFNSDVGTETPLGPVVINSANDIAIGGRFVAGNTEVFYTGDFITGANGFLDLDSLFISPDANSANLRGRVAGAEDKDTATNVGGPKGDLKFVFNDCVIGVECVVPVEPDSETELPTEAEPRPGLGLPTSAEPGIDGIESTASGLPEVLLVMQQRRPSNNPTAYQYSNFGNTELWDNVPGAYSISSFAAFSPKETKAKETPAGAETSQGEQP